MQKNWLELQKQLMGRRKQKNSASMTILAFIGGAAAGAAAGMLMAPDRGEQTRMRLKTRSRSALETSRSKVLDMIDAAKTKMNRANDQVQTALDQGERAASRSTRGTRATPAAPAM